MANYLHLEIVTPNRLFFNDEVKSLTAPGFEGGFQVLPRHAPYITTMLPGTVKILTKDDKPLFFATSGGTVEVHSNNITVLAESIIPKENIDVAEAEKEIDETEKLLNSKEAGLDKAALMQKLNTAKAKIKVANL